MRTNKTYPAILILIFAGLALARADLTAGAFRTALANLSSGGLPALKIVFEIFLLGSILLAVARAIAVDADPLMDGFAVAAACVYGYLAELAGTTYGLWTYYTGERPPLWIIPAWPIGALVIMRLSHRLEAGLESSLGESWSGALYWLWVVVFYSVFIAFIAGKLTAPESVFAVALVSAALFAGAVRRRDLSVLLAGTACVFWADLWGTTSYCWRYHTGTTAFGMAAGISFGMLFDSVLVLAAVKTAAAARRLLTGVV